MYAILAVMHNICRWRYRKCLPNWPLLIS